MMKEIMAIIRGQKVNATKDALAEAGFPAFCGSKVLGRGKKHIAELEASGLLTADELPRDARGESFTESVRLISKRLITLMVEDEEVSHALETIIQVNQSGKPGDGKIFVLPISESWRVRDRALLKGGLSDQGSGSGEGAGAV
ncbi:MAG: P-II family nitrogen regulator [Coriobacteriales bacterium]|jgi:nitrogen regulatory protein PII 2|nr:P-II family nitrogen regulator [Coriobacteriales bacterium]